MRHDSYDVDLKFERVLRVRVSDAHSAKEARIIARAAYAQMPFQEVRLTLIGVVGKPRKIGV